MSPRYQPLAERLRPASLDEVVGQDHLLGPGQVLRLAVERGEVPSLILWGPPGTGKTTIARLLASASDALAGSTAPPALQAGPGRTTAPGRRPARFVHLSAVQAGVKEVRQVVEEASGLLGAQARTYLFLDEIHRFNKAQQDALLPHVESGLITLLGATTENPSFEVVPALLSRCRVVVLRPLGPEALGLLLARAIERAPAWHGAPLQATPEALAHLADYAEGDARRCLTALELAAEQARAAGGTVDNALVGQVLERRLPRYDKGGEEHYNVISAFIKSLRGSDPDAAVYWLARMLEGGEDPRFIVRRMVIFAAEDIGLADPTSLAVAVHALHALELVGLPEGSLPLTQVACHLALAPKSNTVIKARDAAAAAVRAHGSLPVPLHLRNAPTRLLREQGYGAGYQYPHDHPEHVVAAQYLPDALAQARFVEPGQQGRERELAERAERLRAQRRGPR